MPRSASPTSEHPFGPAVSRLIDEFAKLPGIGRKSAERLTHYVLTADEHEVLPLAEALRAVKEAIRPCSICFNLTEGEVCRICNDPRREQEKLCIVEQSRDIVALEACGVYNGLYHVLGGRLSPLDNVGPDDLTIAALVRRIRERGIKEIVMATNPTLEGDGTAFYISNLLEGEEIQITRLARGIASGSVLEFANREMLADALRGRQNF